MRIDVNSNEVTIYATGIEFLRLKTEIGNRIGTLKTNGNQSVTIHMSGLHLIDDLLDDETRADPRVASNLGLFGKHAIARNKALGALIGSNFGNIPDYWLDVLDPAQLNAVASMTVPNILGLCLFDEQGSGKTVMSIAAFDILKDSGLVDAMIVVCPKSMVSEWPKDIERFTSNKYAMTIAEGDRAQKYRSALTGFDVLVANYESVGVMLNLIISTAALKRYLLVIDESYYLKNRESARSNIISQLRSHCKRCFVLCGTPAPNSAHDLVNQFDLADMGYTFAGFQKSKKPADDWDKISLLIESRGLFIRRLKSDILTHVPEKNFHILKVDLRGKQALMYDKARSDLELELKSLNNETFRRGLTAYFQRRAVLLQICACPSALDPIFSETPAKYEALDGLLETLVLQKRKVVLWSFFQRSLDELMIRYRHLKPVRVDGSVTSSNTRKIAVESFQNDPNTMLFLGNPAAAGAGITLHASYDAVYLSYSNQAAHYLQSLDRIHRRGQSSTHVNYYLLVCKDTIEESEILRLRKKELNQHHLLGDDITWPGSLDDALRELSLSSK